MVIFSYIPEFLLVFTRLTCFFISAPIWMERQVPAPFKWGIAFISSLLVMGVIQQPADKMDIDSDYLFLIIKEAIVGLSLGFFSTVLFYAVQLAGSLIDLQSGFAMSALFNPQTGIQEPLTGKFYYSLAMLFFLSVDGHHILLKGVLESYQWIPIGAWLPAAVSGNLVAIALLIMKNMFWIAILISSPIVAAIFLVDLALGILAKAVPQMNLFVVGIPIKLVMHFIVLFICIPVFLSVMEKLVQTMVHSLEQMLHILGA